VHVPSELSRERKAVCNSRASLLQTRTQLINYTRGRLRTRAVVRRGAALRIGGRANQAIAVNQCGVVSRASVHISTTSLAARTPPK